MKKQKSIKSLFMSQRIIALSCLVFLFLFFSCFGKNFLTKNSMVSLLESVLHYLPGFWYDICHFHRRH